MGKIYISEANELEEAESILELFETSRIFSIEKTIDGKYKIQEGCDDYFFAILTRDQLIKLSEEIRQLTA